MAKNPKNKNTRKYLTEEDIDAAFSDANWQNDVAEAGSIAAIKAYELGYDPNLIFQRVIDYNLLKKLRQLVITINDIPKEIDWHGFSINEAYLELEEIIIQANLEKIDKNNTSLKYKIKIITGKSGRLKQDFPMWCDTLKARYPNLNIRYLLDPKNTGCYTLWIK